MKILYIHHAGIFGGASKSMAEMIKAFPKDQVKPIILCQSGSVEPVFEKFAEQLFTVKGIPQIDNTRASHYRGFRWIILLRELYFYLGIKRVLKNVKKLHPDIDIVHFNEITHFTVLAPFVKSLFPCPIILHVRSLQRARDEGRITKLVKNRINQYADEVIAIDQNVKDTLWEFKNISIIHNGLKIPEIDEEYKTGKQFSIMYLGNLLFDKGIVELTQALAILKSKGVDFHANFIGARAATESWKKKFLNQVLWLFGIRKSAEKEVQDIIDNKGIQDDVSIIAFTNELSEYFQKADVLVFASHLNAAGRPVFEAAFHKTPSILACNDPKEDTIVHQKTGIVIDIPSPSKIAEALLEMERDREKTAKMGLGAFNLAVNNFDINKNAIKVLELYRRTLNNNYVRK